MIHRQQFQPLPIHLLVRRQLAFRLRAELRRARQVVEERIAFDDPADFAVFLENAGQEAAALVGQFRACLIDDGLEKRGRQEKAERH